MFEPPSAYDRWKSGFDDKDPWDDPDVWAEYLMRHDEDESNKYRQERGAAQKAIEQEKTNKYNEKLLKKRRATVEFNGKKLIIEIDLLNGQSVVKKIKDITDIEELLKARINDVVGEFDKIMPGILYQKEFYHGIIGADEYLNSDYDTDYTLYTSYGCGGLAPISLGGSDIKFQKIKNGRIYLENIADLNLPSGNLPEKYNKASFLIELKKEQGIFKIKLTHNRNEKELPQRFWMGIQKKYNESNNEKYFDINMFLDYYIILLSVIGLSLITGCKKSRIRQKQKAYMIIKKKRNKETTKERILREEQESEVIRKRYVVTDDEISKKLEEWHENEKEIEVQESDNEYFNEEEIPF